MKLWVQTPAYLQLKLSFLRYFVSQVRRWAAPNDLLNVVVGVRASCRLTDT